MAMSAASTGPALLALPHHQLVRPGRRAVPHGYLVAAVEVAHDLAHSVINMLEGAELSAQVPQGEASLEIAGRHLTRLIGSCR
ncbi:hypothetical protein OHA25_07275 [Nonomuraea sp. NBC_00507]|uniref:hypothetical protein n=1 Tax=Nonomuraea sp. NBC_00507 TaxID=2976002 RepID=UPI002E19582A